MNKIFIIGNLTKDTEASTTSSGISCSKFSIAVPRRFSKEKEVDFFNVIAWRSIADFCNNFLAKGKKVCIIGSIQTSSYEKDGAKRVNYTVVADEVELLSSRAEEEQEKPTKEKRSKKVVAPVEINVDKEDLPF